MERITITGSSDDLIEIDGSITEEWDVDSDKSHLVAVSDGTLLSVKYDENGIWRIHRIFVGSAKWSKVEGDVQADTFDVVTLEGDIKWVALSDKFAK